MENIGIVIIVIGFLVYTFFNKYYEAIEINKEKMMLIRELTTALKSTSSSDYLESLPDYPDNKPDKKEIIKDEFVEIDQVAPEVLLRAIKK